MRRQVAVLISTLALTATALIAGPASSAPTPADAPSAQYRIDGPRTFADRNAVARTGAAIDFIEHGIIHVTATPAEIRAIQRLGFKASLVPQPAQAAGDVGIMDFPSADSLYHNYAETNAELNQIVADHPGIARLFNIGTTYEGRTIYGVKISDNVATDENEPEILFNANQHAREHLTAEQALYLANILTNEYGSTTQITNLVNSREFWIIPMVNPDGVEYDIATGSYRSWRKNRQPNSTTVGTDLNRNWAYQWGCCGGSSSSGSSETYRGPSAFSAPETQRLRDFVLSRRIGGVQQIKVNVDIHTSSQLIRWPSGYKTADTGSDMTADQRNTFATIGQQMAATNSYTPEQASDLYIADGIIIDWMFNNQGIFAYTFELYPGSSGSGGGFYPPDEQIAPQTQRNRAAFLMLSEYADCVYRAIGKEAQYCGTGTPPTTVWQDTFETATGWTINPNGTDTATTGAWERGDPADTNSSGAKQLGTTVSGVNDLVTGSLAGAGAGDYDIDGGTTSARSPAVTLPSTGTLNVSLSWYLAHGSNSSTADFFRVSIVHNGGTTVLFTQAGAAANRNGAWGTGTWNISAYAGQSVRILVEAADASGASLVEAGVDDVRITQQL